MVIKTHQVIEPLDKIEVILTEGDIIICTLINIANTGVYVIETDIDSYEMKSSITMFYPMWRIKSIKLVRKGV